MKNVLLIDDELEMLESMKKLMSRRQDCNPTLVQDPARALKLVREKRFDLIITDLNMQTISGLEILRAALDAFPDATVILISGYGTIDTSVKAMSEGAFDFIEKPFTAKKLFSTIERAFEQTYKKVEQIEPGKNSDPFHGIVYQSKQMTELINVIHRVAKGNMNILVSGESGTGKELIARAIHATSKRNEAAFVPVNCGALPENLFESEIFGHERGAFTGAVKAKPGLLEFASQGTFFLDEIGDLSLAMQVKLLRMLEERKIRRVGSVQEIDVDVRIIAATNKNLEKAINENRFREDLYYRLNTIHLNIPPLRERPDDIIPLANHFLAKLSRENDRVVHRFSPDAIKVLQNLSLPGNVRELQNMVSRAYYLCSGSVIQKQDLPISNPGHATLFSDEILNMTYKNAKETVFEKFEVKYLLHNLKKNAGNISQTADQCGIDRRTIHRLVKKYNIILDD